MKFCKDCKHFHEVHQAVPPTCKRTRAQDPVDGAFIETECCLERSFGGDCGPSGEHYSPSYVSNPTQH